MSGSNGSSRIVWLDGLRGIAVLLILIAHFFPRPAPGEYGTLLAYAHRATKLAFTGVDLFFVLSGFFIGSILGRTTLNREAWLDFYLRRVVRIVPLAWLCAIFTYIGLTLGYHDNFTLKGVAEAYPWWHYYGFVSNWRLAALGWEPGSPMAHFWTLGVEMQFYLTAPILFSALRHPGRVAVCLVALGIGSRLVVCASRPEMLLTTHFLPFCRADAFGLGIAAAVAANHIALRGIAPRAQCSLVVMWLGCASYLIWLLAVNASYSSFAIAGFGYTVIAAFFALGIVVLSARPASVLRTALSQPWLVRFGTYSYFIYLFQDLAGQFVIHAASLLPQRLAAAINYLQLPLTAAVLLSIAPFSWRLIENPLLRLGHRFAARQTC